ncbi:MAG TPA: zinc-ribbon domain-containing protein [Vicinamibacteria bacterium]|nr:zinc-ribbon domain-containing protein [Vicinamibacteria bacterium]
MQTNCPRCSNRLVLDDAKVPTTPFMLKCPKCQGVVKLPGKGGAAKAPPTASPKPPVPPSASPTAAVSPSATTSTAPKGQRVDKVPPPADTTPATAAEAGSAGKALVALSGEQQAAMAAALGRLGFAVEQLDGGDDKPLRLQQGDFDLVAASRTTQSVGGGVCGMVQGVPPDVRRRLFLVLVGDEFQTGESTQAFSVLADLVLHTRDVAGAEGLVAKTLAERRRLYQTYWDTEDKRAEGKL